jgi:hypothetical protein
MTQDRQTVKLARVLAFAVALTTLAGLACGKITPPPEAATDTAEPPATAQPTSTLQPTQTPRPTSTPEPSSTPTPLPSPTPPPPSPTSAPAPAPVTPQQQPPAPPPSPTDGTIYLESRTANEATCQISVWGADIQFLLDGGRGEPASRTVPPGGYSWQVFFGIGRTSQTSISLEPGGSCIFICYDTHVEWGCSP